MSRAGPLSMGLPLSELGRGQRLDKRSEGSVIVESAVVTDPTERFSQK